jgi:hypothetical protein
VPGISPLLDLPPSTPNRRSKIDAMVRCAGRSWPIAVIAIVAFAIGLYARFLNHLFYATHGPFYDSLSYSLNLAALYWRIQEWGLAAGISHAVMVDSTVFLPWIEACFLALVSDLRRDMFVWLQLPWLFVLGAAAYRYFSSNADCSPSLAICLSVPLMAINGIFVFNGGLSDLRMDLFQYLLFGTTCIIYLSIRSYPRAARLRSWALLGVVAGLTCLVRATTPIFFFLVFAPLMVADLFERRGSIRAVLYGYGTAGIMLAAVAGWFYVIHFHYLHYYYFVWNMDANANLPIRQSVAHIWLLFHQNIGWPLSLFLCLSLLLGLVSRRLSGKPLRAQFNWRALWCGVAPISFLVLRGAGPNPFVSMISATGFLIFCATPWEGHMYRPRWIKMALMVGSIAAVAATAAAGIANHQDDRYVGWVPRSAAIAAVVDQLIADLHNRPPGTYAFSMVHSGAINTDVLINTLVFDRAEKYDANSAVSNGHWTLTSFGSAAGALTKMQWEEIPGGDDEERIRGIVQSLLSNSDYLLLPQPDSKFPSYTFVNQYALMIRERLIASGRLTAFGPIISVVPGESVVWYFNHRDP